MCKVATYYFIPLGFYGNLALLFVRLKRFKYVCESVLKANYKIEISSDEKVFQHETKNKNS